MRRFYILHLAFGIALTWLAVSCGQTSLSTPTSLPPSPFSVPSPSATLPVPGGTATQVPPVATSTRAGASVTATVPSRLQTETFQFSSPISEDEVEPIIQAIRNLRGVEDIRAGGQDLQVTYNPEQVSRKQIIAIIEGYGHHVKE